MDSELEEKLQAGIAAARAGDAVRANRIFSEVLNAQPDNIQALIWKGAVTTEPSEAVTLLENAVTLDPTNARARAGLSWAYKRQAEATTGQSAVNEPPAPSHNDPPAIENASAEEFVPEYRAAKPVPAKAIVPEYRAAELAPIEEYTPEAYADTEAYAPEYGAAEPTPTRNFAPEEEYDDFAGYEGEEDVDEPALRATVEAEDDIYATEFAEADYTDDVETPRPATARRQPRPVSARTRPIRRPTARVRLLLPMVLCLLAVGLALLAFPLPTLAPVLAILALVAAVCGVGLLGRVVF